MVLEVQAADLKNLLECEFTQLEFSIEVRNNHTEIWSRHGTTNLTSVSETANLYLTFYIDQMITLSKEDVFSQIERRIADMCCHVNGTFLNRNIQPYDTTKTFKVSYTIKLANITQFYNEVKKLASKKLDKDFEKVLEASLQED